MTTSDKIDLIGALFLMVTLAVAGHAIHGNSLFLAVAFPAVLFGLFFWLRRAWTAQWLEPTEQGELISRRPTTQRLLFGLFTALYIGFLWMIIPHLLPLLTDPDTRVAITALIVLLSLPGFCFLFGAGPRVLRINRQRHQYSLTQGVPFLTWTKRGSTSDGELSVSRSKSGTYALLFRAPRWRFGLPLETFQTEDAARSQAWQIADKLGLSVQRRDMNEAHSFPVSAKADTRRPRP